MKRKYEIRVTRYEGPRLAGIQIRAKIGSALILTVILTSLLAIVGVLFLMVSRVNKIATSAISENKDLNFAVETVIAWISDELVLDVPGVANQEYADFPGSQDKWLANLEPYTSDGNYYWRQISDVTGSLTGFARDIQAKVVPEYASITDSNTSTANADADGDGAGDSKWIKLDNITSGKGKPIYAAIRIVDNGGMLNVNTAFKFDPSGSHETIDGSSQMQINLMALAGRPGNPPTAIQETDLLKARANQGVGVDYLDLKKYEQNVIWNFPRSGNGLRRDEGEPNLPYTPFDISDELELRFRFLLNNSAIDTRLEDWSEEFRKNTMSTPVTTGGQQLDNWFKRAYDIGNIDPNYAYRHITTTCSSDRIIDPNGRKMVNLNTAPLNQLHQALLAGVNSTEREQIAAQLAVNIVDFRDADVDVTTLQAGSITCFGFEAQPFISEIAFYISQIDAATSTNNYFAIELYNPFNVTIPLGDFRLELRRGNTIVSTINLSGYVIAANSRFVITNSSTASSTFGVSRLISAGLGKEDGNLVLAKYVPVSAEPPTFMLIEKYDICLLRKVALTDLYLDRQITNDTWFAWNTAKDKSQFYSRPDNSWNIIYQNLQPTNNTLGMPNGITASQRNYNLENSAGFFTTVGDIAKVFIVGGSADPCDMIGVRLAMQPPEEFIRPDLKKPAFTNIFQYLTVIDPAAFGLVPNETRIKGRININTAPWFVISQLPWMRPQIAQAIAQYRDTDVGGFRSIGDLMQIAEMYYYATDPADLTGPPDLTPSDGAGDDFEERNMIFSRISNLATVRSDVFTAYILVRIGVDGPQKRVIAILDRSNVYTLNGKVKVIALQPVPDPR
ncbi:MAG: helix-hairpin-helix domain-containing protein [Sedimentisphaerales bacterium]|nr:helix-hairpin-helix domain-containing protein [Sedimentisphaerales bacterium]